MFSVDDVVQERITGQKLFLWIERLLKYILRRLLHERESHAATEY